MTADEIALLAAVAAHPDEDVPRLMYADWLDEEDARDPRRVECRACKGSGESRGGGTWWVCAECRGVGAVPDTGRRDRAELIRVQVELARGHPPGRCGAIDAECVSCWLRRTGNPHAHSNGPCRCKPEYRSLRARESALLAAHPDWWPPCPACGGAGRGESHAGPLVCDRCDGTGRVGEFARGFLLSVEVPRLADVLRGLA